jgi:hypothetical protein
MVSRCTNETLLVQWLDYQGREVAMGTLAPGQTGTARTYGGHRWLFRNARTGYLVAEVVMPNYAGRVAVP